MATITLIGMPGAGKSTIGPRLARATQKTFVDTDELLLAHFGQPLQQVINQYGHEFFRQQEDELLCAMPLHNQVIATGGSAVYSQAGMLRLRESGPVVYLRLELATILARIGEGKERGLAAPKEFSMADIYRERSPLYESAASVRVDCDRCDAEDAADKILLLMTL